jgi:hypothetical protein
VEAIGPDPHLERVLLHVDSLHEELDDPGLFGWEQLVPDRGKVGQQDGDITLDDLASPSRLAAAQVCATTSGAASSLST